MVLLMFGPKRLPASASQLGSGMREFKDCDHRARTNDDDDADRRRSSRPASRRAGRAATRTEAPVEAEPRT